MDALFHLRNFYIFQRVHTAAGAFDFLRQKLAGLFHFRQAQHILHHLGQGVHRIVQFAARLCKPIGVHLARLLAFRAEFIARHVHRHDVLKSHIQFYLLFGV